MTNILFVHSSSELYGSDRSLLNIVKNIDKSKYNIYVILPCEGQLVDEMRKIPGVTTAIFEIAVLRRKNLSVVGLLRYIKEFVASFKFIKRFISENKVDIVDTNTAVVFPGAVAAKCCKIKSVWHIREIIKSNTENKVVSFMMNTFADLIIANSKTTAKALAVDQRKIRVVYNAVEEQEDTYHLPNQSLIVGMAGRINRWKGQKFFVDVAEIVHKKFPEVIFHIAGEAYTGETYLKEELKEYIACKNLSDTVILLGQVDNMCEFYQNISIFVLPSIQPEPFGLVVIEAMEYGLPVIATKHGGPVEIITDGVDGYLVDYKDPNEMACRIMELIKDSDKCRTMGECGKEKKRSVFSVSTMIQGVECVFEELL